MHATLVTPDTAALATRVDALVAAYQRIAATRMQGIPLLHDVLRVQAVGFEYVAQSEPKDTVSAVGILVTPWFMNLVWLPLQSLDQPRQVGIKMQRHVGSVCFEFIAAHEDAFGSYETCSLFSPVFEFENQTAAVDTAQAALATLRQPTRAAHMAPTTPTAPSAPEAPARRAFLFGRSATKAGHV